MVHITTLRRAISPGIGRALLPRSAAQSSYGGLVTSRGPLTLAALASAAVPGLDPDTVEGVVPSGPADQVEVAFVSDLEHRRWVIRCPRTPAASAQIERSAALLALLARRLTMPVPAVKGWVALPEGGRAAVHAYLTGRMVNLEGIEAGSTLATGLGRTIAQLHNLDPRVYEEAGVPVYDAAAYRSRRLAELDRAAATGRVPTGLLTRWEQVLDDESLWVFTSTPTHGSIDADTVLATPDDGTDPDVKTILGWESAQVADPADDLAPLLGVLDPEAFDTVLEAYAHARVERPDRHLQERARVIGEMQLVRTMMSAVAAGDDDGAEEHAMQLRRLDDRLAREDEAARSAASPAAPDQSGSDTASADPTKDTRPVETGSTATPGSTDPGHVTSAHVDDAAGAGPKDSDSLKDIRPEAGTEGDEGGQAPLREVTSDPSDSEDAVQVEHPAAATPVTQVTDSEDTTGRETSASEATAGETVADETSVDEPVTEADAAPDTDPASEPDPAPAVNRTDPTTDEITPVDDDDGDDVVSPLRRP